MTTQDITLRPATADDLDAINRVIASAILNWPMANRTKRLAATTHTYDAVDLTDFDIFVCARGKEIIGVAAWDPDYQGTTSLLHGLYVLPIVQGQGIGRKLMDLVFARAAEQKVQGVLVKAERVSASYFEHRHLDRVESAANEYPFQYFKAVNDAA